MRTHCVRVLLAVSASVLAGTLTATIALAATTWTVKPGGAASAKLSGVVVKDATTLAINYTNSTQKLKFLTTGGNLRFYQAVGCAGLIRSQDLLTLSGTGPLAPAQKITSP